MISTEQRAASNLNLAVLTSWGQSLRNAWWELLNFDRLGVKRLRGQAKSSLGAQNFATLYKDKKTNSALTNYYSDYENCLSQGGYLKRQWFRFKSWWNNETAFYRYCKDREKFYCESVKFVPENVIATQQPTATKISRTYRRERRLFSRELSGAITSENLSAIAEKLETIDDSRRSSVIHWLSKKLLSHSGGVLKTLIGFFQSQQSKAQTRSVTPQPEPVANDGGVQREVALSSRGKYGVGVMREVQYFRGCIICSDPHTLNDFHYNLMSAGKAAVSDVAQEKVRVRAHISELQSKHSNRFFYEFWQSTYVSTLYECAYFPLTHLYILVDINALDDDVVLRRQIEHIKRQDENALIILATEPSGQRNLSIGLTMARELNCIGYFEYEGPDCFNKLFNMIDTVLYERVIKKDRSFPRRLQRVLLEQRSRSPFISLEDDFYEIDTTKLAWQGEHLITTDTILNLGLLASWGKSLRNAWRQLINDDVWEKRLRGQARSSLGDERFAALYTKKKTSDTLKNYYSDYENRLSQSGYLKRQWFRFKSWWNHETTFYRYCKDQEMFERESAALVPATESVRQQNPLTKISRTYPHERQMFYSELSAAITSKSLSAIAEKLDTIEDSRQPSVIQWLSKELLYRSGGMLKTLIAFSRARQPKAPSISATSQPESVADNEDKQDALIKIDLRPSEGRREEDVATLDLSSASFWPGRRQAYYDALLLGSRKLAAIIRANALESAHFANPDIAVEDVVREIGSYLNDRDLVSLSSSCAHLFNTLQPDIFKRAGKRLWSAIIDGDRRQVRHILQAHPELLCTPSRRLFTRQELKAGLQSQLTWQTFLITEETPLSFAIKRNQLETIKSIYLAVEDAYNKLTDEQRQEIIQQWEAAEASLTSGGTEQSLAAASAGARTLTSKERSQQFNFQVLIDVIKQETFSNGIGGPLSEATETALESFRQTVLPKGPISLDNYYDIDQLLIRAYQVYIDVFFDWFQNSNQAKLFCIKVIGYIQSLLTLEVAEKFSKGFYYFPENPLVETRRQAILWSAKLRLRGGPNFHCNFYRSTRGCPVGLGFEYYASFGGSAAVDAPRRRGLPRAPLERGVESFRESCRNNTIIIETIKDCMKKIASHPDYFKDPQLRATHRV